GWSRTSPCWYSEPRSPRDHGSVAQLVERSTENRKVTGSTPVGATTTKPPGPPGGFVIPRDDVPAMTLGCALCAPPHLPTVSGMTREDALRLLHAERAALVGALTDLPAERWEEPSLCTGWSVHDVLAHLTAAARTATLPWLVNM